MRILLTSGYQIGSNKKQYLTFCSRNHPIEPFIVQTKKGPIFMEELSEIDKYKAAAFSFRYELETFPIAAKNLKGISDKKGKIQYFEKIHSRILEKEDGNSTILIGKNSKKRVVALVSMHSFDEFARLEEEFLDLKTGYVEECILDAKYRGEGVGTTILNKILETADNHFTDIFLEANNKAVNFYTRAGFERFNVFLPIRKKIYDYILKNRGDRNLITLMTKTLDYSNPWWERIIKCLN